MSKLSKWIREKVADSKGDVVELLDRYAKDQGSDVQTIVHDTVDALEDSEFSNEEKRTVAKKIIAAAVKRWLNITLPGFLIGLLIDWIVARRRAAAEDAKVEFFDYSEDLDAYPDKSKLKLGDIIWQTPQGKFHVQPHGVGYPIPADWHQHEVITGRG